MGLELQAVGMSERLRAMIDASGLQQKEIALRSGVAQATLSRLMTEDDPDPRISTLLPVADVLRVSLDALVREGPTPPSPFTAYDRNPAYQQLVRSLERLGRRDRDRFMEFVDWMLAGKASEDDNVLEFTPHREQPKEMSADVVRTIAAALGEVVEFRKGALWKEYEVPLVGEVSAGSGIEIFETYEKVRQIPQYYWDAGARAVFKVRGHSMLDMGITDRDLLFVRPTEKPKSGDVVICSLNGAAFVKEFERTREGVRLLSHNAEYQAMAVGEQDSLRVFGVVVGRTGDLTGNPRRKRKG